MVDPLKAGDVRFGITLSGGGFRATAWGIGALLGVAKVAEVERNRGGAGPQVVSIASVSGGSIANAAAMMRHTDLNAGTFDSVRDGLAPAARHVAFEGLIMFAKTTRLYVSTLLTVAVLAVLGTAVGVGGLGAVRRPFPIAGGFIAPVVGAGIALVISTFRAGSWRPRLISALVGLILGAAFGAGWLITRDGGVVAPVAALSWIWVGIVLVWLLALMMWATRGGVVERALDRTVLRTTTSRPALLTDYRERSVHHVFCATELQSGRQFFMSPRMLSGYMHGSTAHPAAWRVGLAVQSSACLPLAFPPHVISPKKMGATLEWGSWMSEDVGFDGRQRVVLVDGGVYDNMGTEWELGLANRSARSGDVHRAQPTAANMLVIANAGKSLGWQLWHRDPGLLQEVAGLMRDQSIQYDQTTAPRRRALIAGFRFAEETGRGARGVIVQESTSPLEAARSVAGGRDVPSDKRARATEIADALAACQDEATWRALADRNAAIPTVLHSLGPDATVDLIWHATVLAQTQLYIHQALGDPVITPRADIAHMLT